MHMADIIAFLKLHADMLFYLCGIGGMLSHYIKKWTRNETSASLYAYLFTSSPKSTIAAVMTYFGAATAAIASGTLAGMDMPTIAALGFTTGFAIDSAINKADK